MKEQIKLLFKQMFCEITSLKKLPINSMGGAFLAGLFKMYYKDLNNLSLILLFLLGFIHLNFLVKEANLISNKNFIYYAFFILIILFIAFSISNIPLF